MTTFMYCPLVACCRKVGNDYHHDAAAPRLPTSHTYQSFHHIPIPNHTHDTRYTRRRRGWWRGLLKYASDAPVCTRPARVSLRFGPPQVRVTVVRSESDAACILPNPHSRPTTLARSFVRAPPLVFSLRRCQRHGILCQETPSPLGACCRKVGNDSHHDAAAPRLPTSLEL